MASFDEWCLNLLEGLLLLIVWHHNILINCLLQQMTNYIHKTDQVAPVMAP